VYAPVVMHIVLASQSPRRRLLLEERGIAHEAIHPGIDDALLEPGPMLGTPAQWAAALAYLKAVAGSARVLEAPARGPAIVIGADTVVVKDGVMIGQPRDAADAARIIELLQDGEHEVITGVALVWPVAAAARLERLIFADRAGVRVGHVGSGRIAEYIAGGGWRGKAGAYNLSERLAAGWPITYDGDAGTIMGLPVDKLVAALHIVGHTSGGRPARSAAGGAA
jgi:septum formation protein